NQGRQDGGEHRKPQASHSATSSPGPWGGRPRGAVPEGRGAGKKRTDPHTHGGLVLVDYSPRPPRPTTVGEARKAVRLAQGRGRRAAAPGRFDNSGRQSG